MTDEDILKRIMDCKPEGRKRTERPKLRWIDGVLEDIKKLGINDWWTVAWDRKARRKCRSGSCALQPLVTMILVQSVSKSGFFC